MRNQIKLFFTCSILLLLNWSARAQSPSFNTEYDSVAIAQFLDSMSVFYDSVEATINYLHGDIPIAESAATLHVQEGFKFISAEQSQYIMHALYGNPEDQTIAGILMPEDLGVTYGEGYMFVLYYRESGYVDDKKENEVDDPDLIEIIHKSDLEENRQRVNEGLETFNMIGWARHPEYDPSHHVLTWAKELKFDSDVETNTLNYNIIKFGRNGFIVLNAIATMKDLQAVENAKDKIISMVEFNPGFKYEDYTASADRISEWTLRGLVVGSTSVEVEKPNNNKLIIIIAIIVVALIIFTVQTVKAKKKKQPA